jgi:hypothetical protein
VPVKLVAASFKETCNKADVYNTCTLHFLFRMSWKKGDTLLLLHCNIALVYAIKKVQVH